MQEKFAMTQTIPCKPKTMRKGKITALINYYTDWLVLRTILRIGIITFLLLPGFANRCQADNFYYENAVYKPSVKTVKMYREGFMLSNPIIYVDEEQPLVFTFDDLSTEIKNYSYTIIHCDADWTESFLPQSEYLDGFIENPIDDYAPSYNTIFNYINYRVTLPNENVRLKLSGNYVLVVFEDGDTKNVVLTQRFYVYENQVDIKGTVRRATTDAFKGESQEVDFSIFHPNFSIQNPREEVKVVIMQNNRWDNAITDLKPLYIRDGELNYDYNRENVFKAGNEFRYFDIRTNRYNGENIIATDFIRPYFHKTIHPDEVRNGKKYFAYKDMNGKYVVESQDREVQDFNTECDYVFVHFSLPLESPLLGGSVNVFGELTQWNANESNEMTYNFDTGRYELSLLLKQGYYNYQYVYVPKGATKADHTNLEGSFWLTENDYQIFVYYREISGRYDRLIGYTQLNSSNR